MTNLRNTIQQFLKIILTYLVALWSVIDTVNKKKTIACNPDDIFSLSMKTNGGVFFITFCSKENDLLACVQHFQVWELDGNISEINSTCLWLPSGIHLSPTFRLSFFLLFQKINAISHITENERDT